MERHSDDIYAYAQANQGHACPAGHVLNQAGDTPPSPTQAKIIETLVLERNLERARALGWFDRMQLAEARTVELESELASLKPRLDVWQLVANIRLKIIAERDNEIEQLNDILDESEAELIVATAELADTNEYAELLEGMLDEYKEHLKLRDATIAKMVSQLIRLLAYTGLHVPTDPV